jgi:ketosteroid isomerase-like protein
MPFAFVQACVMITAQGAKKGTAMATRQEIQTLLEKAYAARKQGDVGQLLPLFTEAGRFKAVGAEAARGYAEQKPALEGLIKAFDLLDYKIHCMVIEGSKAAVHWHGKFRSSATGKVAETDLLDLIEVQDGRIASFDNFFDTALAAKLMQP